MEVSTHSQDVGVAGSLARTLMYFSARSGDTAAQENVKALLDAIWANNQHSAGVSTPEIRWDFSRFDDVLASTTGDGVYIPSSWSGAMPNGDVIKPGVTFLDIRNFYLDDPDWSNVQTYLDGGEAPTFNYHRFWAQTEISMALAEYDLLFSGGSGDITPPTAPGTPTVSDITSSSATLAWAASTDDTHATGYTVQDAATGATRGPRDRHDCDGLGSEPVDRVCGEGRCAGCLGQDLDGVRCGELHRRRRDRSR